ncbi:hypothetical protein C7T94_09860 [Pedobacter yulinensis]|uniref:Uncharacterized protein n=1 Tax=Pedobacter yulinensis TaxID=2126353 RepID=A0A2T3HKF7_9SPHI|nr:hypothetical protein [Pedobacter yulinensis]PST82927.1 hypothetical protein C7T94_09860 [Pedobacter yulinensis]
MKTDPVEIFQTIRAVIQPYAALGFVVRENSEATYTLWSEKKTEVAGQQQNELHFASVTIIGDRVDFHFQLPGQDGEAGAGLTLGSLEKTDGHFEITELEDTLLNEVENLLAIGFKKFKQNDWV